MLNILLEEYSKLKKICKEENLELKDVSSVFSPKMIERDLYLSCFYKEQLTKSEIQAIAKAIMGNVLVIYNKKVKDYLNRKNYGTNLELESLLENNVQEINDRVFNWVKEKGYKILSACTNSLKIKDEEELIKLIKICDLQLSFNSGDELEDLIRWLYEVPNALKERLKNNNLVTTDKRKTIDVACYDNESDSGQFLECKVNPEGFDDETVEYINLLYSKLNGEISKLIVAGVSFDCVAYVKNKFKEQNVNSGVFPFGREQIKMLMDNTIWSYVV